MFGWISRTRYFLHYFHILCSKNSAKCEHNIGRSRLQTINLRILHVIFAFWATTLVQTTKMTQEISGSHTSDATWSNPLTLSYHYSPLAYRIVLKKRAGRVRRKRALRLIQFQLNLHPELLNTYTLCGQNMIKIG